MAEEVARSGGAESRRGELLARARALPSVPGVYLLKDAAGQVLYVGKAGLLPRRLGSYFTPGADPGPGKAPLLERVADFDVIPCETEWEALLLENRLIKDLQPRFNARLSDDKTFPYLAVTLGEEFPRVLVTRDLTDPRLRGARILGPFASPGALRHALQLLQRVFKFRTCSLEILESDQRRRFFRPCILHSIGQCTAPCAARISRQAYREDIERFLRFLSSGCSAMVRQLTQEMEQAAAQQRYEHAAVLRDQIRAIERLGERGSLRQRWQPEAEGWLGRSLILDPRRGVRALQKVLALEDAPRCIEGLDVAHLQGGETVAGKVCFVDGRPLRSEYRRYRLRAVPGGNDDYAAIREVIQRRYREAGQGHELFPDVILIDGGAGQMSAALEVFAAMGVRPPMVVALAKGEELLYVQGRASPLRLSRSSAALRLCQAVRDEAHRFARHYHHILRRKKTLGEE